MVKPKVKVEDKTKEKVADSISLSILGLGLVSIALSIYGQFIYASYLIIASALVDIFTGSFKKFLKIASVFGKELDNISDLVSLVLAPAILTIIFFSRTIEFPFSYFFILFPMGMCFAGVIRTSRINSGQITAFQGMKDTFNAMIPVLLLTDFFSPFLVSGWIVLSSVFMLSSFTFRDLIPKRKKKSEYNFKAVRSKYTVDTVDEDEDKEDKGSGDSEGGGLVPLSILGD